MLKFPAPRPVRPAKWLHVIVFIAIPAAILLIAALLWSIQRIVNQEKATIELEFNALVDYIGAQEQFLKSLGVRSRRLLQLPDSARTEHGTQLSPPGNELYVYQVRQSPADIPYAVICSREAACPAADHASGASARLHNIGDFLADFYAAYWSGTYFPGPATLLADGQTGVSLNIPAFSPHASVEDPLTAANLAPAVDLVAAPRAPASTASGIHWLRLPGSPDLLVGLSSITFQPSIWPYAANGVSHPVATIFNLFTATRRVTLPPATNYDAFLLAHDGQALSGDTSLPTATGKLGATLGSSGALLYFSNSNGEWTATYRIPYHTLFQAHPWLPLGTLLMLMACLAAGAAYSRWYRRHVIVPMERAQHELVESEAFSRTLLDTAPVALCIVSRPEGAMLFANVRANQWLAQHQEAPAAPTFGSLLPADILAASQPGHHNELLLHKRHVHIAYAPTRYHHQDALLCAFMDVDSMVQHTQALKQAKQAADTANAAKSRFLAAMSHELRTPLHGIQGTLELLALTPLQDIQRLHIQRLKQSSDILMQLIDDILDVRKLEAGQLALNPAPLQPGRLVQSCADLYFDEASKKGILLFACIDSHTPEWVLGDDARLRQILGKFLSNAIRFTDAGQIVIRLYSKRTKSGHEKLIFQVADSGTGMSTQEQNKLLALFQHPRSAFQTAQDTGLGLAISANLAHLMHGDIQMTSEAGLGSSFSLALMLPACQPGQPTTTPRLEGLRIFVRSPHAELTQNLCLWFETWGACATPASMARGQEAPDAIWLDVLIPIAQRPATWTGRYALAGIQEQATDASMLAITAIGANDIAQHLSCAYFRDKSLTAVTDLPSKPVLQPADSSDNSGDGSETAAILELGLIPGRHRTLFRETMLSDAQVLATMTKRQDATGTQQALHRMHGALFSMQQLTLARQAGALESALQHGDRSAALYTRATRLAARLRELIDLHLPS